MIGWRRGRRRAVADCGHHYHPTEHGWQCCGCPTRVRAGKVAEPAGAGPCRQAPPGAESVAAWLAPPAPIGHRPGRRRYRRAPV